MQVRLFGALLETVKYTTGVNVLPWTVVTETVVGRKYHPSFPKYLKKLDGMQVQLTGYMQALGEDQEGGEFMLIEYPVRCWYCEMPDVTAIVLVDLPEGKTAGHHAQPPAHHGTASP